MGRSSKLLVQGGAPYAQNKAYKYQFIAGGPICLFSQLFIVECGQVLKWTYAYYIMLMNMRRGSSLHLQDEVEPGLECLHQCAKKELQVHLNVDGPLKDSNEFHTKLARLARYWKMEKPMFRKKLSPSDVRTCLEIPRRIALNLPKYEVEGSNGKAEMVMRVRDQTGRNWRFRRGSRRDGRAVTENHREFILHREDGSSTTVSSTSIVRRDALMEQIKALVYRHPDKLYMETTGGKNKGYHAEMTVVTYCRNRKDIDDKSKFRILLISLCLLMHLIWNMYFRDLLPRLVKPGDDGNSGSTAVCDTICLQDIRGNDVPLRNYNGKVVLIVNVASKWQVTLYNLREDMGTKSYEEAIAGLKKLLRTNSSEEVQTWTKGFAPAEDHESTRDEDPCEYNAVGNELGEWIWLSTGDRGYKIRMEDNN
ncbi:putative E3 ubiquitin-protein ligase ARI8 [Camellia lanceoleosa]|uniref:E3 ubiquitin-protein ligase ARI8 n=1 Tax=Camellia lanceoleosa TaxID=1840588 RepID=A0ACC0H7K6_9ERIC|nr:putative E3 ubiquitin-protein ligase ARI8 [Camellia lanceoleosa]